MQIPTGYTALPDGSITPDAGTNPHIVPRGYTRHADGRLIPYPARKPTEAERELTHSFNSFLNKRGNN